MARVPAPMKEWQDHREKLIKFYNKMVEIRNMPDDEFVERRKQAATELNQRYVNFEALQKDVDKITIETATVPMREYDRDCGYPFYHYCDTDKMQYFFQPHRRALVRFVGLHSVTKRAFEQAFDDYGQACLLSAINAQMMGQKIPNIVSDDLRDRLVRRKKNDRGGKYRVKFRFLLDGNPVFYEIENTSINNFKKIVSFFHYALEYRGGKLYAFCKRKNSGQGDLIPHPSRLELFKPPFCEVLDKKGGYVEVDVVQMDCNAGFFSREPHKLWKTSNEEAQMLYEYVKDF